MDCTYGLQNCKPLVFINSVYGMNCYFRASLRDAYALKIFYTAKSAVYNP